MVWCSFALTAFAFVSCRSRPRFGLESNMKLVRLLSLTAVLSLFTTKRKLRPNFSTLFKFPATQSLVRCGKRPRSDENGSSEAANDRFVRRREVEAKAPKGFRKEANYRKKRTTCRCCSGDLFRHSLERLSAARDLCSFGAAIIH